jgi:hypothetical protein
MAAGSFIFKADGQWPFQGHFGRRLDAIGCH